MPSLTYQTVFSVENTDPSVSSATIRLSIEAHLTDGDTSAEKKSLRVNTMLTNVTSGANLSRRYFYTATCQESSCSGVTLQDFKLERGYPAQMLVFVHDDRALWKGVWGAPRVQLKVRAVNPENGFVVK